MAWRLKLVPEKTNWDFFQWQWLTFGAPVAAIVDLSRMELEAQVPVAEIPYVKIGQEISLSASTSSIQAACSSANCA